MTELRAALDRAVAETPRAELPAGIAALIREPGAVNSVPVERIPALLAELAALQSSLVATLLGATNAGRGAQRQGTGDAEGDRLLSIPEAAEILRVDPDYVYELGRRHEREKSGGLPTVRFGKYVRVRLSTLREWIERHEKSPSAPKRTGQSRIRHV